MDNLKLRQKAQIEALQYGVYVEDKLKGMFICYEDAEILSRIYKKTKSNVEIAPMPYFQVKFGK